MYFIRLTVVTILIFPTFAHCLNLNSLELCIDKHFVKKISIVNGVKKIDELKCDITIQENEQININDFDVLYAIASVSNLEKKAHERLEIHWVFLQDEKIREANTFKLSNTYYSKNFGLLTDNSNSKYVQLEEEYKDTYLGWIVSIVRMYIQRSQNFRTHSEKTFDKKLHIGKWKLTVIEKKVVGGEDSQLYQKEFIVYKK